MAHVLVINGPNMNLLGTREPEIYGGMTLDQVNDAMRALAEELRLDIEFMQSNSEAEIVTAIQQAIGRTAVIILNPAGLTHSSVSIRDAIAACGIPTIECHVTNPYKRALAEPFRAHSMTAPVCAGIVAGFGTSSYLVALYAARLLAEEA